VNDTNRLMYGGGTHNITNPPPDLITSEIDTMIDSPFTIKGKGGQTKVLKEQLIELLDRDEPDYNSAASLGPECLPDLLELTKEGGARLAPRAVYTASLIKDNNVTEILKEGASSPIADVR
ncbi:hypothetical protein ACUOBA_44770, partial [Escherichia coli]